MINKFFPYTTLPTLMNQVPDCVTDMNELSRWVRAMATREDFWLVSGSQWVTDGGQGTS